MEPYIPEELPIDMSRWDWQKLLINVSETSAALAYYNGILKSMINPAIFLSPLETKEAVLSSRIEGTVTTIDEVLKYEVDLKPENFNKQNDIIEVLNYRKATRHAKDWLSRGMPFNLTLICAIQNELMQGVRGKDKRPGEVRKEQVWIGMRNCSMDEATFVPPEPTSITEHLGRLMAYLRQDNHEVLIQTAIMHAQFELIHPFMDGNGRTGRILIPLFLWQKQRLESPMFYVSEYFDEHRDDYDCNLSAISQQQDWEKWVLFFLDAVRVQARRNAEKVSQVLNLYSEMKARITSISNSPNAIRVLDSLFSMPIFRSSDFVEISGLNPQTAFRIVTRLKEESILTTLKKPAGRSPEIFLFGDLYRLLES
jgi:Fic family protein